MRYKFSLPAFVLCVSPAAVFLLLLLSVLYGAKPISPAVIWDALIRFDPGNVDHQIIRTSRLPRAAGAMLIGAFLAVSGALMQGITRNVLASPSIMGVSDGSVFLVTLGMVLLPQSGGIGLIGLSMVGSALGASLVFGLARLVPGGLSPVTLAIIGTVIGTFLGGASAAIAAYFQVSQGIAFWYNARLNQLDPAMIKLALPFAAVGLTLAVLLSRSVTALALGEEVAANLGQRTGLTKSLAMLAVVLLTGAAVAMAGKIAFIGLIIPHIARFLAGLDYRWIIPVSGVLGGIFLSFCDLLSRFVNYPFETPVGVVTALFGVPFFLYLIRKKGGARHG